MGSLLRQLSSVIVIFLACVGTGTAQWQVQRLGMNYLTGCHFLDNQTGWITDGAGNIARTTDGGADLDNRKL